MYSCNNVKRVFTQSERQDKTLCRTKKITSWKFWIRIKYGFCIIWCRFGLNFPEYNHWQNSWDKLKFKSSSFVSKKIFTITDKIFISGVGLRTRQWFYEVLRYSWYILISWGPKSSACEQLVYNTSFLVALCFTCAQRKMSSTVKESQNIMNMTVCKIFFCFLCLY